MFLIHHCIYIFIYEFGKEINLFLSKDQGKHTIHFITIHQTFLPFEVRMKNEHTFPA